MKKADETPAHKQQQAPPSVKAGEGPIQSSQVTSPIAAPPAVSPIQQQLGAPLLERLQASFGSDFSNVKIHENSRRAVDLRARAFAQGNDVHFAPGQFAPHTSAGRHLIGHEFAHVVQQRMGVAQGIQASGILSPLESRLEQEADMWSTRVNANLPVRCETLPKTYRGNLRTIQFVRDVGAEEPKVVEDIEANIGVITVNVDADADWNIRELGLRIEIHRDILQADQPNVFLQAKAVNEDHYRDILEFHSTHARSLKVVAQQIGSAFSPFLLSLSDGHKLAIFNKFTNPEVSAEDKKNSYLLELYDYKNHRLKNPVEFQLFTDHYNPTDSAKITHQPNFDLSVGVPTDSFPKNAVSLEEIRFQIGPHQDEYGVVFKRLNTRGMAEIHVRGYSTGVSVSWQTPFAIPIPDTGIKESDDPFNFLAPTFIPEKNYITVTFHPMRTPWLFIYLETNSAPKRMDQPTEARRLNKLLIQVAKGNSGAQSEIVEKTTKDYFGNRQVYQAEISGLLQTGNHKFTTQESYRSSLDDLVVDATADAFKQFKGAPEKTKMEQVTYDKFVTLVKLLRDADAMGITEPAVYQSFVDMYIAFLWLDVNCERDRIKAFADKFSVFSIHYGNFVSTAFGGRTNGGVWPLTQQNKAFGLEAIKAELGKDDNKTPPTDVIPPSPSKPSPKTLPVKGYSWERGETEDFPSQEISKQYVDYSTTLGEVLPTTNELLAPVYQVIFDELGNLLQKPTQSVTQQQLDTFRQATMVLTRSYARIVADQITMRLVFGTGNFQRKYTAEEERQLNLEAAIRSELGAQRAFDDFFFKYYNADWSDRPLYQPEMDDRIGTIIPGKARYYPLKGNEYGQISGSPIEIYLYTSRHHKDFIPRVGENFFGRSEGGDWNQYANVLCVAKKPFHKELQITGSSEQYPNELFQLLNDDDFLPAGLLVYEFPSIGLRGDVRLTGEGEWYEKLDTVSFWAGVGGLVVSFIPVVNTVLAPMLFGVSSIAGATGHIFKALDQWEENGEVTSKEIFLTTMDILMGIADTAGAIEGLIAFRRLRRANQQLSLEKQVLGGDKSPEAKFELQKIRESANLSFTKYTAEGWGSKVFAVTKFMDLTGNVGAYLVISSDFLAQFIDVMRSDELSWWEKAKFVTLGIATGLVGTYACSKKYEDWSVHMGTRSSYKELYGSKAGTTEKSTPVTHSIFSKKDIVEYAGKEKPDTKTSLQKIEEIEKILTESNINKKTILELKAAYPDIFADASTRFSLQRRYISDQELMGKIVQYKGDLNNVKKWLDWRNQELLSARQFISKMRTEQAAATKKAETSSNILKNHDGKIEHAKTIISDENKAASVLILKEIEHLRKSSLGKNNTLTMGHLEYLATDIGHQIDKPLEEILAEFAAHLKDVKVESGTQVLGKKIKRFFFSFFGKQDQVVINKETQNRIEKIVTDLGTHNSEWMKRLDQLNLERTRLDALNKQDILLAQMLDEILQINDRNIFFKSVRKFLFQQTNRLSQATVDFTMRNLDNVDVIKTLQKLAENALEMMGEDQSEREDLEKIKEYKAILDDELQKIRVEHDRESHKE